MPIDYKKVTQMYINRPEDYYARHKEDFAKPYWYKIQQITVNTMEDAQDISNSLKSGASFSWLAKRRSLLPCNPNYQGQKAILPIGRGQLRGIILNFFQKISQEQPPAGLFNQHSLRQGLVVVRYSRRIFHQLKSRITSPCSKTVVVVMVEESLSGKPLFS